MKRAGFAVLLLVVFGSSVAVQTRIDRRGPGQGIDEEKLNLQSGETLRRSSFGFNGLLADLYWIRTILYFGGKLEEQRAAGGALDPRLMPLLEPLLRITTEIDPRHIAAFRFGAFFLPYHDPERAITFTRRGIGQNPLEWRLYQDLGMIYWRTGRYAEASRAYSDGASLPGAPDWMRGMAATMAARGGDRVTAREIFTRLYRESSDEFIRRVCLEQLELIDRAEAKPER